MKVIIFAGGWGTRLGQITDIIPKPMVKIGDKPILWHIMKIYSFYGYHQFLICLGVKGDVIKDYFIHYREISCDLSISLKNNTISYHSHHDELNWQIELVDTGLNTLKGGRLKRIEKYLDDDINLLTYGDGVVDIDINKLIAFHKSHGKILTLTGVHTSERFGELDLKENQLIRFVEKPKQSKKYLNGGYMVFNKHLLDYLTPAEDCDFEFGILEDLARKNEVMVYKHEGNWECLDHERDMHYLNQLWNNNKAFWKVWK